MERITNKQLEYLVSEINEKLNRSKESYARDENGRRKANIGNFHLSFAYGGVCLYEMTNEGGGVTTPLVYGHVPKRELYSAMRSFISGLNMK